MIFSNRRKTTTNKSDRFSLSVNYSVMEKFFLIWKVCALISLRALRNVVSYKPTASHSNPSECVKMSLCEFNARVWLFVQRKFVEISEKIETILIKRIDLNFSIIIINKILLCIVYTQQIIQNRALRNCREQLSMRILTAVISPFWQYIRLELCWFNFTEKAKQFRYLVKEFSFH